MMIQLSPLTVAVVWVIMLLIWAPYLSLKGLIKIHESKLLFSLRAMKVLNLDPTRKCIIRAWNISFKTPGVSMVNKEINPFLWRAFKINLWIVVINLKNPKRHRHNPI